jgi:polyphosphate kinase
MPRNLDRRVELLVPIEDAPCRRKAAQEEQSPVRAQRWLYEMAVGAVEQMEHDQRTLFQPHIGSRAKRLEG